MQQQQAPKGKAVDIPSEANRDKRINFEEDNNNTASSSDNLPSSRDDLNDNPGSDDNRGTSELSSSQNKETNSGLEGSRS